MPSLELELDASIEATMALVSVLSAQVTHIVFHHHGPVANSEAVLREDENLVDLAQHRAREGVLPDAKKWPAEAGPGRARRAPLVSWRAQAARCILRTPTSSSRSALVAWIAPIWRVSPPHASG